MSADPITLGIGGAVLGGVLDKENPLRGAALGGAGGYFGGPLFNAAPSAPGMAGSLGSGIGASAAQGAGMAGSLGNGLSASQAGGMGLLGAEGGGLAGGQLASNSAMLSASGSPAQIASAAAAADMSKNMQLAMQGGKMLMGDKRQQQQAPMGIAPPMMRPNMQPASFISTSPYAPVVRLGQNRNVAPNRRG